MKKKIIGYTTVLIGGPLFGLILLLLVFLLPTEPMKSHIYSSKGMIEKEFTDEEVVDGFNTTLTGNFTDCLMMEHAVYTGNHSVLEQAVNMYRGESYYSEEDETIWHPGESLIDYLEGRDQVREVQYSRYWHGYLVVLKPLLLITSFGSIRIFNSCLQLLLVGICIVLFGNKKRNDIATCFIISIPFLFFISTFASLSQSICMYLMLITVIVQLCMDEKLARQRNYALFFMIVGMCTSYFDFLTYPLITLGYPLVIYISLRGDKIKTALRSMIVLSANWGIGYFWMWFSKWIIADITTGSSTIKDAFGTILTRTGSAESMGRMQGFIKVINLNIGAYLNRGFILFIAVALLIFLLLGIKNRKNYFIPRINKFIPYAIIGAYPFVWWFITQNHSMEHWMFTCRIFAITVFGISLGVQKMLIKSDK